MFRAIMTQANQRLRRSLGLSEDVDPDRPIANYGIDSLVAVEFRNWARAELGVEVSTLEVLGAKTLTALCRVMFEKGFNPGS